MESPQKFQKTREKGYLEGLLTFLGKKLLVLDENVNPSTPRPEDQGLPSA
jgi:hypothetical protein